MANWWDAAPKVTPFDEAIEAEGVSGKLADIARSIYQQESGSGKNTKTSNAGAVGGMQIIPDTFASVADKGWNINDPVQNARAGIRYVKQGFDAAGGDPALTGAYYYGGPGGMEKAKRGVAVSDPRNPGAPTTLQYGQQVAARVPKERGLVQKAVEAVVPSANAAEQGNWWDAAPLADEKPGAAPAQPEGGGAAFGVQPKGFVGSAVEGAKNLGAGAVRGAASIGSTILSPFDAAYDVTQGQPLGTSNKLRRQSIDSAAASLADPESINFQAGKLGTEIAGTLGTGGVLAAPLRTVAPRAANALASGGMQIGAGGGAVTNALTRVAGGATTGAASAGLIDPETAGTGAIIGGAIPGATQAAGMVGRGVGKALAGKGIAPEVAALADRAKALGIDIPADRLVNSKPLNALAASLDYVPLSGRTATMNRMEDQLNRAVSRTFGQDSPNVTQALRKAGDELGAKFDAVLSKNTVRVDKQFVDDLAEAANQASRELGSDGAGIIGKQVDDIMTKAAAGEIDGQAAYNIKKTLDRISNRNTPEAFYARDLKQKLMEALNRSLGPEEAAAFAGVRKQYGNMLALEKLAQNGADGGISIGRLSNLKNINNPELQELADISAQFLKSREGPHGAAQRVGLGVGAAGLGFGTGTLPAVGAGMALGRGANMLLNSNTAKAALTGRTNLLARLVGEPDVTELIARGAPPALAGPLSGR